MDSEMNQIVEIRKNGGTGLLGVLIVWGLAVAAAAEAGVYRAIYPLGLACLIALGIVAPVAVYSMSRGFRTYVATIGLRTLTAFHIWRIAAALVFFWYGAHDLLPEAFVRNAGWGTSSRG
ncbi:putative membrane protein [Burkholderia cepacia]|nr:putative membrane protein [Burkholderia cepacia]